MGQRFRSGINYRLSRGNLTNVKTIDDIKAEMQQQCGLKMIKKLPIQSNEY